MSTLLSIINHTIQDKILSIDFLWLGTCFVCSPKILNCIYIGRLFTTAVKCMNEVCPLCVICMQWNVVSLCNRYPELLSSLILFPYQGQLLSGQQICANFPTQVDNFRCFTTISKTSPHIMRYQPCTLHLSGMWEERQCSIYPLSCLFTSSKLNKTPFYCIA